MSKEKDGNEAKADLAKISKERKPTKELTPEQIQKRKKMLIYPLFFLIFLGAIWLIFAPSGAKDEEKTGGFNSELPIPKDEAIVGDKRTAYEQEAMRNKQNEKRRNLQDFAFILSEEEERKGEQISISSENRLMRDENNSSRTNKSLQSSTDAFRDVNRQLNDWHEPTATYMDNQHQIELEERIEELERQLTEKSETDRQLELIEKSYAIATKYMPEAKGGVPQEAPSIQASGSSSVAKEKTVAKSVSQVPKGVVSLLALPMENDDFIEQYGKARNMGFITATQSETLPDKNSIRASVYQTVTVSNGKELQLRLSEPMIAGDIRIPAGTVLTAIAKIGGERLLISVRSIQYAENVIPVEMEAYDMDGMQGISIPNSDEINAMKEIAANMGTSTGSSITISDNAGSQLASDLGKGLIQGVSQFFSKKMREVKVTLKAGYKVLLLPKD